MGSIPTFGLLLLIEHANQQKKLKKNDTLHSLLIALSICIIIWLGFPIPKNYLFAPNIEFTIFLQQLDKGLNGTTQITYLNNGIYDFPTSQIDFTQPVQKNSTDKNTELSFDKTGKSQFSWSGRSWKSILIVMKSTQDLSVLVDMDGQSAQYSLHENETLNIAIPIKSREYFIFLQTMVLASTFLSVFVLVYIGVLVKYLPLLNILKSGISKTVGEKIIKGLLWFYSGFFTLGIVFTGFFNRLYSDDFCYIYRLQSKGFLGAIIHYLKINNGRYSSHVFNFLAYSFPQLNTVSGAITAVLLIGGGLFFLFNQLLNQFERSVRLKISGLVAITLIGGVFLIVPSLYESFIWNIHSIIVSGGFVFFCISCGLFVMNYNKIFSPKQFYFWAGFVFVWGIIGAGFAEVTTTLNIELVTLLIVFLFIQRKKHKNKQIIFFLLLYLLSNIIGLLLMVSVPGSSERMSLTFSGEITKIISYYYKMIQYSFSQIFSKKPIQTLLTILTVFWGVYFIGKTLPSPLKWIKQSLSFSEKLFLAMTPVLLYFIAFMPLAFFMGIFPPRTMAIPICFMMTNLGISALILGNSQHGNVSQGNILNTVLPVLFFVTIILTFRNFRNFYLNVTLNRNEWDLRNEAILNAVAKGDKEFFVTPYEYPLGTDLSTRENLWLIDCTRDYYGIDIIVMDK